MLGLGKLKSLWPKTMKQMQHENMIIINARIGKNQETVYQAVKAIGRPINGRVVAAHLKWDSASCTNRLSELCKKGRLKVAYRKKGLDKLWRNYYIVNDK